MVAGLGGGEREREEWVGRWVGRWSQVLAAGGEVAPAPVCVSECVCE